MTKNTLCLIFFTLWVSTALIAQEYQSVHELHKLQFGNNEIHKQAVCDTSGEIIELYPNSGKSLSSAVFGYLPDWEYKTARNYLKYDLLTHIAAFDFACDSLGNISNPLYWPWKDIIDSAHIHGVKMIMAVTCFDDDKIHYLINNAEAKNRFFTNVKSRISGYKLDGVNIDFEGLKTADRSQAINNFMKELTDFIHANFPGSEVSFAGPAVNWGSWNFLSLAASCDYIFIMGYDYFGGWSTTSGPTAPLNGMNYCVQNTLLRTDRGYGTVLASAPEKLILGVPYFGKHWKTKTSSAFSPVVEYVGSTFFRNDVVNAQSYGRIWEPNYGVPWYSYQQDTLWHQIWYDDQESIALKYKLAASRKIKGVGMWALGQDGSRNELWQLLKDSFTTDVDGKQPIDRIPSGYFLAQNYPNPFNPTTVISYQLPEAAQVTLKVYDILGREVTTLVNEFQNAGTYNSEFRTENSELSAGVYIARLKAGSYSKAIKMELIK